MAYEMTLRSLEGIGGALDKLSAIDLERSRARKEHELNLRKLDLQQQETEAQNRLSLLGAQETVKEREAARESRRTQEKLAQEQSQRDIERMDITKRAEQREIESNELKPFGIRLRNTFIEMGLEGDALTREMTRAEEAAGPSLWIIPTTSEGAREILLKSEDWARQLALLEIKNNEPGAAARTQMASATRLADALTKGNIPRADAQAMIDRLGGGIHMGIFEREEIDDITNEKKITTTYIPQYVSTEEATEQLYQKADEELRKTRPLYATLREGDLRKIKALEDKMYLDKQLSDPSIANDEQTKNDLKDAFDEKHFHERYQDEQGEWIDRGIRTEQGIKPAKRYGTTPISTPLKPVETPPSTRWTPPPGTGAMSLGQAATVLPSAAVKGIGKGIAGVGRGIEWYTKPTGEFELTPPIQTPKPIQKPIVPEPKPEKTSSLNRNQDVVSAFNNMMSYLGNQNRQV